MWNIKSRYLCISIIKKCRQSSCSNASKNLKQRLSETLLLLHVKCNTKNEGVIDIQLSREDIANIIGKVTESAIRLL